MTFNKPTMPYNISNNLASLRFDDSAYDSYRKEALRKYCDVMHIAIHAEIDNLPEDEALTYDWRELARVNLYDAIHGYSDTDFMTDIGDHLEPIELARFILKMADVIKEDDDGYGQEFDMPANIGELYGTWLYVIALYNIDFKIEYDDEEILLRPE
jgi:hypothetical protein